MHADTPPQRKDIQCLRGVAVSLVLFYHLNTPGFQGGFIGVDIFLVISGYLVVGSVLKSHLIRSTEFSFAEFLTRRSRRLLLPSIVCLLFIILFTHIQESSEWYNSRRAITFSSFSMANIHFYSESTEYFAPDFQNSLVLHYWSLGLEEQFFFFFPLLFMFFSWWYNKTYRSRLTVRATVIFMGILCLLSFGGCYVVSDSAKFFLVPFRVWEFLVGAFVWLLEQHSSLLSSRTPSMIFPIGLTCFLIFFSPLVPSESYPNAYTLVVVLVTGVIIFFGKKDLDFPFLERVGDVSYSLYLYHWPVIRFIRPIFLHHVMRGGDLIFTLTCFILFEIFTRSSFSLVEGPSRRSKMSPRLWILIFILCIVVVLGLVRTIPPPPEPVGYDQMDLKVEGNEELVQILLENVRKSKLWGFDLKGWVKDTQILWQQGDPNKCLLLVGDSHAIMYLHTMQKLSSKYNLSFWLDATPAWTTPENANNFFIRNTFPFVPEKFRACERKIIFMSSSSHGRNLTSFYMSRDYMLNQSGVVGDNRGGCVIQPVRIFYPQRDPVTCILDGKVPLHECALSAHGKQWEEDPKKVPHVKGHHMLQVNDLLCPSFPCLFYHGVIPKWKDAGHLTRQIVELITPELISRIESFPCVGHVLGF
eukprot:TRINITY_DN12586_c0_g2_i1.p1 TRINITY_DN12586_c0_g2~~TRINITY_DN12586_c0_g2_i1.p1  ORF type:complete len:642 (-),score=88.01 TRINITY_DN12586_c0_g2_i1:752-2677(-)